MRLRSIAVMAAILAVLAAAYVATRRPAPAPQEKPREFLWSVEMDDLRRIAISLPSEGKAEAWVRHDDQYWYFDEPGGPKVDMKRWGGGIPLLLSGPGTNRSIADDAGSELLAIYGFNAPAARIELTLANGQEIKVEVGDRTPGGEASYVRLTDSRGVYTVDQTWVDVLERLVREPPYPKP
jgi:hypothetical protein